MSPGAATPHEQAARITVHPSLFHHIVVACATQRRLGLQPDSKVMSMRSWPAPSSDRPGSAMRTNPRRTDVMRPVSIRCFFAHATQLTMTRPILHERNWLVASLSQTTPDTTRLEWLNWYGRRRSSRKNYW